MKTVGQRIKERRESLGMSQKELALMVGYQSRSAINKIETNPKREVKPTKLEVFASALQCSVPFLLGLDEQETMEFSNIKGQRIHTARKNARLTLKELGAKVGVSDATIKRYETGEISNIPSEKIEAIAEATGVSCEFLMGWNKINNKNTSFHTSTPNDKNLEKMIKKYKKLNVTEQKAVLHVIDAFLLNRTIL